MRTTITLDDDVAARLRQIMRERDITFRQAVNTTLRAGLVGKPDDEPYRLEPRDLGLRPGVDLTKALALADALEDEEIIRKLQLGK